MTQPTMKVSNVKVVSNVWICAEDPHGRDNNVHNACLHMPGDLRVKMSDIGFLTIPAIEQAIDQGRMTQKQRREMLAFRFFLPHTHADNDLVVRGR